MVADPIEAFPAAPSAAQISTVRASALAQPSFRLDARHYQEEFVLAKARVMGSGYPIQPMDKLAAAHVPGRMKLFTVSLPGVGAPYLRAHDVFEVRPETNRFIAEQRTSGYESYLLQEGMLLTPSSGRNLGPLAYVTKQLAKFAMTDILRIVPFDRDTGFYLLAYLLTPTGQALIRRGRTGTTVDHLSATDVLDIPVLWPDDNVRRQFGHAMEVAERLLDEARARLDELEEELHRKANLPLPLPLHNGAAPDGVVAFGLRASQLNLRLDAAFYDTRVEYCRKALARAGAKGLTEVAQLRLLGRYKRYYVDKHHGRPILSGRQLLQLRPVNLQYISDRSFTSPQAFILRKGWTIFTCDGRAEEALGDPAYVHSRWDGWMASNHVMRALPLDHIRPGYLYLALRSPYVQLQLKSRATGSVVDALDPITLSDVLVPLLEQSDRDVLGMAVEEAWEKVAQAIEIEEDAVSKLEDFIVRAYEEGVRRP